MKAKFLGSVLAVLMLTIFTKSASAQPNGTTYKSAVGIKVWPFAANFKTFVGNRDRAIELLAYFSDGFRVTGLYEFHTDITTQGNLKLYAGLGGHAGYYDKSGEKEGFSLGVDGVIGLDYKFNKIPLNLALDWQPSFEFITPSTSFQGNRGGLAIRYTL
jgi:hypothetical protein